ncbi:SEC-C metal-binding domain-containing protein [Peribacillus psychrosaccharolyticus]|uniref:SEC-C metal-binding domain-containing protein n=1 Tax=Peribacillus psychrosaccharolyticus TaxID=1407 RepID=UPI003D299FDB
MIKANRNDPCPCGSGKKYKKCCERKVTEIPVMINYEEARQIQKDLIDYTEKQYQDEIVKLAEKQPIYSTLDEETQDLYLFNFRMWGMLSQPLVNGHTILEEYLIEQGDSIIRTKTKEIVESWLNTAPSLLMIQGINEDVLSLEDIVTKKAYSLPMDGYREQNMDGDSLILGYPVEMEEVMSFFTPFISIEMQHTKKILEAMKEQLSAFNGQAEEFMVKQFPEVLNALFAVVKGNELSESAGLDWGNEKQEETARILQKGMEQEEYPEELIELTQKLWNTFCLQESPVIRKPEAFAAAMEYAVKQISSGEFGLSQGKLAEKYGVGASTISKRFKEIETVLSEELTPAR